MRGDGLPGAHSCKEHFPLISCGGGLVRRNCFSNGCLRPFARRLGKVCLPEKKKRNLRAFPFCARAAAGDACRCFHFCLRACPSGWGDGSVRLRRNQPQIYIKKEEIPRGHQPAAPAPASAETACQRQNMGPQSTPRLCSHIRSLIDFNNEHWGKH